MPEPDDLKLVPMELREVQIKTDALGGSQVVVLGEREGEREFPIFIGSNEALALDLALHKYQNPRPMTHDLVLNVIEGMGGSLERIVVDDLRQSTYFGKLVVRLASGETEWIDTRPSDAIVLATKRRVPIYVNEPVLDAATSASEDDEE